MPVLLARQQTSFVSPYNIAQVYTDLGKSDDAFRWLKIAFDQRDESLFTLLNNDFGIDSIRSDLRYAELLRKTGIPPQK